MAKTKRAVQKPRNPQDATLRNTRARTREIAEVLRHVRELRRRVAALEQRCAGVR